MSVCHCKVQVNRKNGFGAVPCLRVQFRECYIIPSPRPFLLGLVPQIYVHTRAHTQFRKRRRRRSKKKNGGDRESPSHEWWRRKHKLCNQLATSSQSSLSLSLSLPLSLNIVFSYISISFLLFLEDGGIYGQAYTRREH